ncbi:2-amino-4-hydroxy-6-hydroxymethyldihydropteridine diphosphokinase [Thermodesulfatator atlanticus]|nr:2-amino-4-hydroxy-6-hydroxymethyldihydropteridine diphosphokinase [Thermodesulfatator atlanticus]
MGSNLGDRYFFCKRALWALKSYPGITLKRWSNIYLTPPVGFSSAHEFFNLVAEIETSLSPWALLFVLWQIELSLGRIRKGFVADRNIDLDILTYGDEVIDDGVLKIPHPGLAKRAFVLMPLNELQPYQKHPMLKRTYRALLKSCPEAEKKAIKRLGPLCLD